MVAVSRILLLVSLGRDGSVFKLGSSLTTFSGSLTEEPTHSRYPLKKRCSGAASGLRTVSGTSEEVTPSFARLTLFTIEDFIFPKVLDKRCLVLSTKSLSILLRSIALAVRLLDSIAPNLVAFQALLAAAPPIKYPGFKKSAAPDIYLYPFVSGFTPTDCETKSPKLL